MPDCIVIDTYPDFIEYWDEFGQMSIEKQIEGWASRYMVHWPELLEKQIKEYENENVDWQQVAREKVFPFLKERQLDIQLAHEYLLKSYQPIYMATRQMFRYDVPLVFVLYVGVGLGAGWATTYQQSSALLFGLENVAEEGWSKPAAIEGLIAHEMGHLVHLYYRAQAGKEMGSGPWWDLYMEGFAQRCEHMLLGKDSWHMALGTGYHNWLKWCKKNKRWLAAEFLRRVKVREDISPFFGSWFEVRGRKQIGYFLGHELVKRLEAQNSFEEIAVIDKVDNCFEQLIIDMAGDST
jgi:hypothetical protein